MNIEKIKFDEKGLVAGDRSRCRDKGSPDTWPI